MELLLLLLDRPGELVSREDLGRRLWGDDLFLDRDAGLHTAILKIRRALGGTTKAVFIETVPGSGYRFVAPVQRTEGATSQAPHASTSHRLERPGHEPSGRPDQLRWP